MNLSAVLLDEGGARGSGTEGWKMESGGVVLLTQQCK